MKNWPLLIAVSAVVAVLGLLVKQPALLLLGIVGAVGVFAVRTILESGAKRLRQEQAPPHPALVPFLQVRDELGRLAASGETPEVRAISKEALVEAETLVGAVESFLAGAPKGSTPMKSEQWPQFQAALDSLRAIMNKMSAVPTLEQPDTTSLVDRINTLSASYDEAVETIRTGEE